MNRFRIGIAGWNFAPWRKHFYPSDLTQKRELQYASEKLRTIEINSTFYALQKPESFLRWYDETPKDFVFSVKGPKYITHVRKLNDVKGPLANFFASGLLALKEKLGPVFWQLPPSLKYDHKRLEDFFKILPKNTTEAAKLALKTDDHFKRERYLPKGKPIAIRYALEVRHESFAENKIEFLKLLKKYKIAVVSTDPTENWPVFKDLTTDFAYARLDGGSFSKTAKRYSPKQLKAWAKQVNEWSGAKRKVFMYIVHEAKLNAPFDAQAIQKILDRSKTS